MRVRDKDKREEKRRERKKKAELAVWRFFNAIKLAIFPDNITCDLCGEELTADTRYNLCAECTSKLPTVGEHICLNCGVPLLDEADFCVRCENRESLYDYNRSPLVYDGIAKDLILALKFSKKKYIAKTLGAMMCDEYIKCGIDAEIAVFVPMTEWEERRDASIRRSCSPARLPTGLDFRCCLRLSRSRIRHRRSSLALRKERKILKTRSRAYTERLRTEKFC